MTRWATELFERDAQLKLAGPFLKATGSLLKGTAKAGLGLGKAVVKHPFLAAGGLAAGTLAGAGYLGSKILHTPTTTSDTQSR